MRLCVPFALALLACKGTTAPPPLPNFELDCDSSDTATKAELFCFRTDTRNGEILRVNYLALPGTNGPTAMPATGPAGQFATTCAATSTDTHSDFYCIRLNTVTGEMMVIALPKIGTIPK